MGYGTSAAATTSDGYDRDGRPIRQTDPDGNVTLIAYDGAGRVVSQIVTDIYGAQVAFTGHTYDRDGNVLSTMDGDWNLTLYSYDGAGRVLSEDMYDQA